MKWIQKEIKTSFNTKKDTYIKNLEKCAELIINHVNKNSKIVCVTDFDSDGLGSSYVISELFKAMNYPIKIHIPHRSEGYGLSKQIIDKYSDSDLIITCDCGITAIEEVKYGKEKYGMEFLISDHHTVLPELPDCLVLNPKVDSSEFTKDLCGAGVAWYLTREISKKMDLKWNPIDIIDVVAMSTIADMVQLDGANRAIVKKGLNMINKKQFSSKGLEKIFEDYSQEIESETIAFGISPIFNSAGRLDHMSKSFRLLNGELELYDEIIELNDFRKDLQHKFIEKAMDSVDLSKKIIIYENNEIPKGIMGLVASELTNKFYKPSVVISNNHGSGRSVEDINIYNLIFKTGNPYIKNGGGHAPQLA